MFFFPFFLFFLFLFLVDSEQCRPLNGKLRTIARGLEPVGSSLAAPYAVQVRCFRLGLLLIPLSPPNTHTCPHRSTGLLLSEDLSFRPKSSVVRETKRNKRLADGHDARIERRSAHRAMKRVRHDTEDDVRIVTASVAAAAPTPTTHTASTEALAPTAAAAAAAVPPGGALANGTAAAGTTAVLVPATVEDINDLVKGLRSSTLATPAAWKSLRQLLAQGETSVAAFLQCSKAMDMLLYRLSDHNHQLQAAWCITNIAASVTEHTAVAMAAAPTLIALLQSPNPLLQDQVACGLGNMAGDGPVHPPKRRTRAFRAPRNSATTWVLARAGGQGSM